MLYIIRKGFYRKIFCYKSYQVTFLESLDTAPLKPGTYRTTQIVDGRLVCEQRRLWRDCADVLLIWLFLFILLFTYKLFFKDFRMLYIIRKGFYRRIFCYKSYQVTFLESLDTAPLKPGTYRTTQIVDGRLVCVQRRLWRDCADVLLIWLFLFILLFTYKLFFKDFRMLYIIRKGFYRRIFCYKSYQVTFLESLDTAPLKPGTYRTTQIVDGRLESSMAVKVSNHLSVETYCTKLCRYCGQKSGMGGYASSCLIIISLVWLHTSSEERHLSRLMTKPTKHGIWSESSMSAWRKLGSLATHWTHRTRRMPKLIWVFAGRTVILLVLSWGGLILF